MARQEVTTPYQGSEVSEAVGEVLRTRFQDAGVESISNGLVTALVNHLGADVALRSLRLVLGQE